jgi:hypothetical protein
MSSMVMGGHALDTFARQAPTDQAVTAHPRGQGFGVLSRIARVRAEETAYLPRHRLSGPADANAQVSLAS